MKISEINILGGGKTAFNLYKVLQKNNITSKIYCYKNDYAAKKIKDVIFVEDYLELETDVFRNSIITSEKFFSDFSESLKGEFSSHYYLRNKSNLNIIAAEIGVLTIKELTLDNVNFPFFVKPNQSGESKVPFKTKLVQDRNDFEIVKPYLQNCIVQEYLSSDDFKQISIAGYFSGMPESLIAVQQLNQYPEGVSSYVEIFNNEKTNELIREISYYLNSLKFKGFIELEFKCQKLTNKFYLMDINPRPWGWFYFYLSGVNNLYDVILKDQAPKLILKNTWVNLPRLLMSNFKGKNINPKLSEFLNHKICYEPYFNY